MSIFTTRERARRPLSLGPMSRYAATSVSTDAAELALRTTGAIKHQNISALADRSSLPHVLLHAHRTERLDPDVLAYWLPDAWVDNMPHDALTKPEWSELFDATGYVDNGERITRPTTRTTLFRAAPVQFQRNWSWTPNEEYAFSFAGQMWRFPTGWRLYRTIAPPAAVLMRVERFGNVEYAVNVDDLPIDTIAVVTP